MKIFTQILLSGLTLICLQACSFRSTQLDLIMSAFDDDNDQVPFEDLAWTMLWSGNSYSLIPIFPVEGSPLTNFMDREGEMLVAFDGWQVIRANGVLPNAQDVEIEKTDGNMAYSNADGILANHSCEEFASSLQGDTTVWLQECNSPEGPYSNEIRVGASGSITLLRFLIHPDYPMLTLTPDNLFF